MPNVSPPSKRIVLTTFGSLGDLHPYLALAIGLRDRGHLPVLATHGVYRAKVESEGIAFHAVAPDIADFGDEREFTRRAFATRGGIEFLVRKAVVEPFPRTYADLQAVVEAHQADLVIGHPLTFAARMVAEKRGVPWLSVALAPGSFLSAYDPFVFPQAAFISALQPAIGVAMFRGLLNLLTKVPYRWTKPVRDFRRTIGLPPSDADPLFDGQFSPYGTLALFASALGLPQPDWPAKATQTGFCFYDKLAAGSDLPPEAEEFLSTGDAPVVFTLGSAAVMDAGRFYEVSNAAARQLGCRAILLTGRDPRNIPASLPAGVIAIPYAPFSQLFPRCAVIVHQGGVGTTGQAMRSGRPQLVVPHGFDQPDNAHRIVQRGLGLPISRSGYHAGSVTRALSALLTGTGYAARAAEVGARIRGENGIAAACDAVESVLEVA